MNNFWLSTNTNLSNLTTWQLREWLTVVEEWKAAVNEAGTKQGGSRL